MLGKWGVGPSKNGVTWGVLQLHLLCVCVGKGGSKVPLFTVCGEEK